MNETVDPSVAMAHALAPSIAYHDVATLRAHPRFDDAYAAIVDGFAELYGNDRRLIRNLFEIDRAVAFMLVVAVAEVQRPDAPDNWLTLPQLSDALAQLGVTDPRRVRRIVGDMRDDALIEVRRLGTDKRKMLIQPSERMRALDREWLAMFHRPLALLYPDDARFAPGVAGDVEYQRAYRIEGLATLSMASKIMTSNRTIGFFMGQGVGLRIVAVLVQAMRGNVERRVPPGFYSQAAVRCGVSRVHVRNVLRDAEAAGLVTIRDGVMEVADGVAEDLRRWFAESLAGVDLVCALAWRRMQGD